MTSRNQRIARNVKAARYARYIEGRLDEATALIDRALDAPDERAPTPLRGAE